MASTKTHDYHILPPDPWPLIGATGAFALFGGAVMWMHDNPYAFEEDRRRDLDLELADWHVIRLTWRQVAEQPERVLALLRKRLTPARSER